MIRSLQNDSISNVNSRPCQLLVSVRDCTEASLCLAVGVDWIDLKEPSSGSLGMPSAMVAQQVAQVLARQANRSVALGELSELVACDDRMEAAVGLSRLFPVAKVGLAGMSTVRGWQSRLNQLRHALVAELTPVVYADWQRCSAPSPQSIVEWSSEGRSSYVLFDTYFKDGRSLLDHFAMHELRSLMESATEAGTQVVLAGSLRATDVPELVGLPCSALAVRGAVCSGSRQGSLCRSRLVDWIQLLGETANQRAAQGLAFLESE